MEGKYSVEGYYIFDGTRGSQSGDLELFSDGKLIGKIRDKDDIEAEKLVLGVHFDESRRITFIKIAPGLRRIKDVMPVMWDLRRAGDDLLYTGHFGFLGDDFPILAEIEGRMHKGESLGNLSEISSDILKKLYFNPEILGRLEDYSRGRGWSGELLLSRI